MTKREIISNIKENLLELSEVTFDKLNCKNNICVKILFNKAYTQEEIKVLIDDVANLAPDTKILLWYLQKLYHKK